MVVDVGRRNRVVHPFVLRLIDIELRTKWPLVGAALGALIHNGTLCAGKRQLFAVSLDEVLADFRADKFEEKTEMRNHRVVAANRLAVLRVIEEANQREQRKQCRGPQPDQRERRQHQAQQGKDYAARPCPVALRYQ